VNRLRISIILAAILAVGVEASAQDASKKSASIWRPEEGVYAVPGKTFEMRCGELGDAFIDFADNLIGGSEYGCEVRKTTASAPGALTIEADCSDAQTEQTKRELILLKRVDDRNFSWRQITAGSKDRGITFSYCPEPIQELNRQDKARSKAEADRKRASEPAQKQ